MVNPKTQYKLNSFSLRKQGLQFLERGLPSTSRTQTFSAAELPSETSPTPVASVKVWS
jgi:hypothetical protein